MPFVRTGPFLMTTSRPTAATKTIGVILAGGQSSRMGQDKAALRIAGESLLLRARRILLAAGCDRILLSGHARPGWPGAHIPDQRPGTGPVSGIVSALYDIAIHNEHLYPCLLFIPVDAPLLSPTLLASMLQKASESDVGCRIAHSPLPVVLKPTDRVLKQCALAMTALASGQSCSVKRFVEPLDLIAFDDNESIKAQLVNVNTPAEWEGLLRELETCT